MKALAVIPSIDRSPYLEGLIDVLNDCDIGSVIYDNRDDRPTDLARFNTGYWWMPGKSIYVEWNHGVRWGLVWDLPTFILNDDIVIEPCVLMSLLDTLNANEDYAIIGGYMGHGQNVCRAPDLREITAANGRRDFTNWCFVVRPSLWVPIDERYKVWYGDDDMIYKNKRVGVCYGLGMYHDTSTTTRTLDWVHAAVREDEALWLNRQ